jgi:hypothetical protein
MRHSRQRETKPSDTADRGDKNKITAYRERQNQETQQIEETKPRAQQTERKTKPRAQQTERETKPRETVDSER